MKKMIVTMLAASVFSFSDAYAQTEKKQTPVPFNDVLANAWSADKVQSISSAKMIYKVTKGDTVRLLLVRAEKGDRARLDIISKNGLFTACRNQDAFWGYDDKNGLSAMTDGQTKEMKRDIAILPIPFDRHKVFEDLTPNGTGLFRSTKCLIFKTVPLFAPDESRQFWLDEKTKLICMVKIYNNDGLSITSFRNYKDFDGVQLASRIQLSSPKEVITFRLLAAEWNPVFPDGLFAKHDPAKDDDLIQLRKEILTLKAPAKKPDAVQVKKEAAVKKASDDKMAKHIALEKQIAAVDKEIRDLTIKIDAKQKRLEALEQLFKEDRSVGIDAAQKGAAPKYTYCSAWSYDGWTRSYSGRSSQRRLARKMYKEAQEIASEYDRVSNELTEMQIKLGDARASRERLEKKQVSFN